MPHVEEMKADARSYAKAIEQERKEIESRPRTLDEVYKRLRKWIYMSNTDRVDLILATAISTFSDDKPLWIFLVGQSGSGKSEIVKGLLDLPFVRQIDQLTGNTLASGKQDVHDLGAELANKHTLMVFTDLACLTTLNKDEKKKIWGQFRNLYDGDIMKDTGSGVKKKYENCHVTILACTTGAIKDEYNINQQLGTRELMYGIQSNPLEDAIIMKKTMAHRNKEAEMKKDITTSISGFLRNCKFNPDLELPDDIFEWLCKQCIKLKLLRATVANTDWYTGEPQGDAEAEIPSRLIQQFSLLYRSLMCLDKDYPDEKFKNIVENIVKSSSHPIRYKLYKHFKEHSDEWFNVRQLQDATRIGRKSLIRECDLLWNIHSLERKTEEETVGGYVFMDNDGYEQKRGGRVERVNYYRAVPKKINQKELKI